MQPEVINVDILDDEEPHVLVQQYVFPDQTFQVFRKPTSPDEKFALSPGEEIDPDLYWTVARTLFETGEELDGMPELFALVYLDDENPPVYDKTQLGDGEPIMAVAYDAEAKCYRCEACTDDYDAVDDISAPTLDKAIRRGLQKLYDILAGRA